MNDRIKELRCELGLNQEDFGNHLGVTKSAISVVESGKRKMTESNIKLICRVFNVNESWLRHGIGEIFADKTQGILYKLAIEYNLDDLDKLLVETYARLPETQKRAIKEYMQSVTEEMQPEKSETLEENAQKETSPEQNADDVIARQQNEIEDLKKTVEELKSDKVVLGQAIKVIQDEKSQKAKAEERAEKAEKNTKKLNAETKKLNDAEDRDRKNALGGDKAAI